MKRNRRDFAILNLSFLDIISCGFGSVVLLVLISSYFDSNLSDNSNTATALLGDVLHADALVKDLKRQLLTDKDEMASKQALFKRLGKMSADVQDQLQLSVEKAEKLNKDLVGLEIIETSLKKLKHVIIPQGRNIRRDEEVGGIPVDSDYVVFIVDTSGSMQEIWGQVTRELENVIRIHPKIKGFQILNDNGVHLISSYEGRWIPDTSGRRESAIKLFKGWKSFSNSNPVEGIEVALKRYANPNTSLSLYIFGDEYSGGSYDPVIDSLVNLNTNRITDEGLARVHAVGFLSSYSTGRFATLMREVTRRNNGTFIALPK